MMNRGLALLNAERLIGGFLVLLGAAELYAATGLRVGAEFTLGPGALPIVYALGLILFAALLAFRRTERGTSERAESGAELRSAVLFFGLLLLFAAVTALAGFLIALLLFSFLTLILVVKWSLVKSALFSAIWSLALYAVFRFVLKVPLESGSLFS
jgi:putative tricarboxylic transport membrane protein